MDNVTQLKNSLISKIQNATDLDFLKALSDLFNSSDDELFILNELQQFSINKSKEEIKNGEFVTHSNAISNLKKWLEKK